ncbi:MAG: glycosyltransferase [Thermodesulfobacteriota bacterium]|nr:glycosyltransferase [Thermodesulfobacteriota bacterium]
MKVNPKTNPVELSIAIPFWNEEENAKNVVTEMVSTLQKHGIFYELILVNNGSRDRTGEILNELCEENPRLKSIHLIANAGYGGGIITGLHHCSGMYLGYTWGDNQIKAEDVVKVYEKVKEVNSDWGKGYRTKRFYGLKRKIISRVYNMLFKLIFRAPTRDVNGVPKIFTRACYEELDVRSTNWFIDAEVMLKSIDKTYDFVEIPVIYHKREGGSSNVNFLTVVEFVVNMIQYKRGKKINKKSRKIESLNRRKIICDIYKIYWKIGPLHGLYAMIRMILVPFGKIDKVIPKEGEILDLGCGNGLFSHFMRLKSEDRTIIGVDIDRSRIDVAQLTVNGLDSIRFSHGDANNTSLDNIKNMTLIDLMHHMPFHEQSKLIKDIFSHMNNGGVVVIKDLKKSPKWKYIIHYIHDMISYKGRKLYFRSSQEMVQLLEDVGFYVREYHIDKWNIYPHIVYLCEKRPLFN